MPLAPAIRTSPTPSARRRRRLTSALVIAAALLAPARGEAARPPLASYTTSDGLAGSRVLRIVRDSRGFLWFCTDNGLSRFDGRHFETVAAEGELVKDLHETRDGVYWVGTAGAGVLRFEPDKPAPGGRVQSTPIPVGEGHLTNDVSRLYEDRSGRLWAGSMAGLFRLRAAQGRDERDRHFEPVPLDVPGHPDDTVHVWSFAEDDHGCLWIGHAFGLTRLLPDGGRAHYALDSVARVDWVWDLAFDARGLLWVANERWLYALRPDDPARARDRRLFPWRRLDAPPNDARPGSVPIRLPTEPGTAVRFTGAHAGMSDAPGPLLLGRDGHVWVGVGDAVEFDGTRFRRYDVLSGVRSATGSPVITLEEDVAGNVWMGTHTAGALRLARDGLVSFGPEDGLAERSTTALFAGPRGETCAQGPGFSLRCFDGARFSTTRVRLPEGAEDRGWEPFGSILRARDGEWWVTTNGGLARFAAGAASQLERRPSAVYGPRDGMASAQLARILEDAAGDLWIGNAGPEERPLTRRQRSTGRFEAIGRERGLPAGVTVRALTQDHQGQLWVGFSEGGLARRRPDGSFELLAEVDRMATGAVLALLVDEARRLWVATSRGGLLRCDQPSAARPRFSALTTREGLGANAVRCLVEDATGRLYAGGPRGIDRLDPRTGSLRRYTVADGVAGSFFHAAWRDGSGALWFGGRHALSRLIPAPERARPRPRVLIAGVRVAGQPLAIAPLGSERFGPIDLGPSERRVQIEYLAVDFTSAELRFEYRLAADEGWSAPTAERSVTYARLAAGWHRFAVRLAGQGEDAATAEVVLRVLPPLWQRAWFLGLCGLLLAAGAYGLHRYRLARLLAVERVRRRIADDLHDDLGASLSRLSILSEVLRREVQARDPGTARRLDEIAAGARQAVDATGDIVWSTDPRRDDLANLAAHARELASGLLDPAGIDWELSAPEAEVPLGPDQRRQLFLIVKEALHNVVKHSGARRVELRLTRETRWLRLTIEDDGRGLPEGLAGESGPAAGRQGHGLDSIRQRAAALGGRLTIERGASRGLRLSLDMPLRRKDA